jgi:cycloeucalenol cycloisomerase
MTETPRSRWFSANPDKAWVEKFFLAYSPIWMASMGLQVAVGADKNWSDGALLAYSVVVALGPLVIPMLLARRFTTKPWHDSYWLKAYLYLFTFQFFGSYFGSEYFFDVLGMVYSYPTITTTMDSALVGTGKQVVPLIMYAWAQVFFLTYHATANIVLRRLRGLGGGVVVFAISVFVIGYFWAWLETKAMANPMVATTFYYQKLDVMLKFGSAIYATYFVASFPIYYFIDETKERTWTWWQAIAGGLCASMLTLYLLDFAAHAIGSL